MANTLEVIGVQKSFRGFQALSDVSLVVRDRELHGLIGPNGAGKSTLLHLIFGREFPDRGQIMFNGSDISRLEARARARRGIGLKLQLTSVFPGLSVEQNLRLGALARATRGEALADQLRVMMDLIGLADRRAAPAGQLSHGEAKWLEIGMVLLTRPRLLLLDEPTAGMDPAETRRTGALLRSLRDDRIVDAILIVEHDMEFIRQVSDRLTVLHRGRVLAEGSVESVRADSLVRDAYLGRAP
jgi:ABC-type uncharacterized transport system ATPase subunit